MKIQRTLAVIGVWASLGCGQLAAQTRTGQRFTLTGTVVDGVSNRPISGVEVSLQTEKWEAVDAPVVSDAQGRFAFGGLSAGEYILSAEAAGIGTVHYGEAPDPGWVSTVHATGDKSLVFRIVPRGAIEGVVRDEFGDPMMGAMVSIGRPLWREGRTTMANVGQKSTDDRGRYRFGSLAPGNYVVCAGGSQNAAPVEGPVDYTARVENRFYTRTCARPFQLAPGQRTQVDLSPLTGATATVRGRVRNLPPQTGFSLFLAPEDTGVNQNYGAFVDPSQGTFTIRGVQPGRYRLRASVSYSGGILNAELPVDVGGSDDDVLDVVLDAGGTVDVAFHGLTENHIDPAGVSASLRNVDSRSGSYGYGSTRGKDGALHFEGLPPGRYRLGARTSQGGCVESVKLGSREVRGATFDLAAGAALHFDVTMSNNCGSIETRAMRGDAPVPGAKVVLLLSGTAQAPGDMMEDFADDEGEYSFTGLTPGRYLLWSWAVEGKGAIAGPASLAAVEQQATTVEVKGGDTVHVDVPLLSGEDKGQ